MIDDSKIQTFAMQIIQGYKKHTILPFISNLTKYTDSLNNEKFIQIGERILLPTEFFLKEGNFENSILAADFARSLAFGEVNYILDFLTQEAKDNRIQVFEMTKFSYDNLISNILRLEEPPTDIFIPIDHIYWNTVHDWIYQGRAKYEDGFYIILNGIKMRVHWSSKAKPFNNVFLINRKGIDIIQKNYEDMKLLRDVEILYSYKDNEPVRVDFGKSEKLDQFDFFFRSVISIPKLNSNYVGMIKLQESDET